MVIHPAFKTICGLCSMVKIVIYDTALWKIYICPLCDGHAPITFPGTYNG